MGLWGLIREFPLWCRQCPAEFWHLPCWVHRHWLVVIEPLRCEAEEILMLFSVH